MSSSFASAAPVGGKLTFEQLRAGLLWLFFASSFIVKFEPALSDLLFLLLVPLYAFSGLRFAGPVTVLAALLVVYNFGGFLSMLPVFDKPRTGMFLVTSIYMASAAILLSAMIPCAPSRTLKTIKSGWLLGAFLSSIIGILAALNIAGLGDSLTLAGRAQGLFKDPNVFSTYLVFPIILVMQRLLVKPEGNLYLNIIMAITFFAAVFLAFSRGAWISVAFALLMLLFMSFALSDQTRTRSRIVISSILIGFGLIAVLAILLSIPEIRELAIERASFNQKYDVGEAGRFGNQLNSIPLLLKSPLGLGPLQFADYFGQDPHNTFLNGFSSYGWLGGITYLVLCALTTVIGIKTILMRGPWQVEAIAIFCPLFATMLQGVQIDMDHWRHYYWLMGMMWGVFGATVLYASQRPANRPDDH